MVFDKIGEQMGIPSRTGLIPFTRAEAVYRPDGMKHDRLKPQFVDSYERLCCHYQPLNMFPRGDEFFGLVSDFSVKGDLAEVRVFPSVGEQTLAQRNLVNIFDNKDVRLSSPAQILDRTEQGDMTTLQLELQPEFMGQDFGHRAYSLNTLSWYFPFRRQIRANYGDSTIRVYQNMDNRGADHFLGSYSLPKSFYGKSRVWIKPSLLWTMRRSQWGTAEGRERIVAVDILRSTFESLLFRSHLIDPIIGINYDTEERFCHDTEVNPNYVQWDPDKNLSGERMYRRALMLGIVPAQLADYEEGIVKLTDVSAELKQARNPLLPFEFVYPTPSELLRRLEMNQFCLSESPVAKQWLSDLIRES